jgi:transposase-like protein
MRKRKTGTGGRPALAPPAGLETVEGVVRGRPGRRTTEERTQAVLELLSGKASVDQLASRFGVQASTVAKWREEALVAVESAMRRGTSKSPKEAELERKVGVMEKAMTRLIMEKELMERAIEQFPSRPGRSLK